MVDVRSLVNTLKRLLKDARINFGEPTGAWESFRCPLDDKSFFSLICKGTMLCYLNNQLHYYDNRLCTSRLVLVMHKAIGVCFPD